MALTKTPIELSSTPGIVDNSNATAITIDSSENVGIGTGAPNFTLQIDSNRADATFDANNVSTWADLKIQGDTASGNARGIYFDFDQDTGNDKGAGIVGISGDATGGVGSLAFITTTGNTSAERMRIDSSGDVVVGGISSGANDAVSLSSSGYIQAIVNGDTVGYFNRRTSDGEILRFQKNGTTVGSIGYGAGVLGIGQGTGNLGLYNANVIPMGSVSGAASDGVITLGGSARRFKDLYLSGGVHLGGTGAANKLSDFETGTWTPLLSDGTNTNATYSVQVGTYTKIGNSVHVQGRLTTTALGSVSGDIQIAGLPFNSANVSNAYSTASFGYAGGLNISAGVAVTGTIQANIPRIAMRTWDAATGTTNMTQAEWSANGDIIFSAEYTAA